MLTSRESHGLKRYGTNRSHKERDRTRGGVATAPHTRSPQAEWGKEAPLRCTTREEMNDRSQKHVQQALANFPESSNPMGLLQERVVRPILETKSLGAESE